MCINMGLIVDILCHVFVIIHLQFIMIIEYLPNFSYVVCGNGALCDVFFMRTCFLKRRYFVNM